MLNWLEVIKGVPFLCGGPCLPIPMLPSLDSADAFGECIPVHRTLHLPLRLLAREIAEWLTPFDASELHAFLARCCGTRGCCLFWRMSVLQTSTVCSKWVDSGSVQFLTNLPAFSIACFFVGRMPAKIYNLLSGSTNGGAQRALTSARCDIARHAKYTNEWTILKECRCRNTYLSASRDWFIATSIHTFEGPFWISSGSTYDTCSSSQIW